MQKETQHSTSDRSAYYAYAIFANDTSVRLPRACSSVEECFHFMETMLVLMPEYDFTWKLEAPVRPRRPQAPLDEEVWKKNLP